MGKPAFPRPHNIPTNTPHCTGCGTEEPEKFNKNKSTLSGWQHYCVKCHGERYYKYRPRPKPVPKVVAIVPYVAPIPLPVHDLAEIRSAVDAHDDAKAKVDKCRTALVKAEVSLNDALVNERTSYRHLADLIAEVKAGIRRQITSVLTTLPKEIHAGVVADIAMDILGEDFKIPSPLSTGPYTDRAEKYVLGHPEGVTCPEVARAIGQSAACCDGTLRQVAKARGTIEHRGRMWYPYTSTG